MTWEELKKFAEDNAGIVWVVRHHDTVEETISCRGVCFFENGCVGVFGDMFASGRTYEQMKKIIEALQ